MAKKDYVIEKMKAHQQFKFGGFLSSLYLMGFFIIESGDLSKKGAYLLSVLIVIFFIFSLWQRNKQLKLSEKLERL